MMDEQELSISKLPAESFLIQDESLHDIDAPFQAWLREQGFNLGFGKGHYSACD